MNLKRLLVIWKWTKITFNSTHKEQKARKWCSGQTKLMAWIQSSVKFQLISTTMHNKCLKFHHFLKSITWWLCLIKKLLTFSDWWKFHKMLKFNAKAQSNVTSEVLQSKPTLKQQGWGQARWQLLTSRFMLIQHWLLRLRWWMLIRLCWLWIRTQPKSRRNWQPRWIYSTKASWFPAGSTISGIYS